jgi:signal transduction histidine kinase
MSSASGSGDGPGGGRRPRLLSDATGLDAAARAERLAFFELGPDDAERLAAYRPVAEAAVDDVVRDFYAHLLRFPELARLLTDAPGRIERLKELQRRYFLELAAGRPDADYVESRLRVGNAHQEIGLRPGWYIGAFSRYLRLALRSLVASSGDGATVLPTIESIIKMVLLDMSLAMETYIYGGFVERAAAAEMERAARVAEEALAARAEVERLKDDLTRMVVHDLKNPVNGISMMVQLALRKARDLPEQHRGYLQQIDRTCREMMRLIQNLLEIGKIEEGRMPVAREPVVAAEVVDEVAAEYGPVAEQSARELVVDVGIELPPLCADRALVKRVLVNLVVNALRHSGAPTVEVRGVAGPGAGEVTIAVADRGRGIPHHQRTHVFEKFVTVRRAPTDDPATDTGLGLPFCRLAVERRGGRIELESAPGGETVFRVTLPVFVDGRSKEE